MEKQFCLVCKSEVNMNHAQLWTRNGPICMGCEGAMVDAWKVTLAGEKCGYCEIDPNNIIDMLTEMGEGDGYTITKSKIRAVEYHNSPEFEGF